MNTTDATLPTYTRAEVETAKPNLDLVHDLLGGTTVMHEKSRTYIRKWADEKDAVYDIRRKIEEVDEVLGRTLSAAIGMLFAKAPSIEWNASEAAMSEQWNNIDAAGTKGTVFAKRFAESAVRDGLGLILVDHSPQPADVLVHSGNEGLLGLRPTWATYSRDQIVSWRTAVVNNQRMVTQLVLYECADVDDGVFGIKKSHRYRVLRMVDGAATWTLFEQLKDDPMKAVDFRVIGSGYFRNKNGRLAPGLPIGIAYTGRSDAPLTATIPLLGVAYANLGHWRQSTNLRFYRELCSFPQPTLKGEIAPELGAAGVPVPGKLRIGPAVAVHLMGADASFTWSELAGSSLDQIEKGVQEKLKAMSRLGMSFLATDSRAAETAEAKRLDATAENSTLATAAQGIEDGLNSATEWHAWYLGIDKAGAPTIRINRDYESTAMDASTMLAYVTAVRDAGLPVRLLLEAWQAGERIPGDTDLEQLEAEMLANAAATAEQQAQAAADTAALNGGTSNNKGETKARSVKIMDKSGNLTHTLVSEN